MNRLGLLLAAERERWIYWLPVGLGGGIATYFGLPVEPPRWIGPLVLLLLALACVILRRHWAALPLMGAVVVGLGFTLAVERNAAVKAPVLGQATGVFRLEGRVAEREPQEDGQRIVLDRIADAAALSAGEKPQRVRLHLPLAVVVQPGDRIAIEAVLFPPPQPAAPGAFDFARQAWFAGIGGVGYAVGLPHTLREAPADAGLVEDVRLWIADQRHRLTDRIVSSNVAAGLAPGVGATAAALITAERGPVAPETLQAFRDAGLAHILVIAGMHLSMVAGLVFLGLRSLLAAVPPIALRWDVKKLTAAGALAVTFVYLVISGAPIPTQRAFIMNGIILVAVLLDRDALSLRSITWAATFILVRTPEALLGASFQLSFAAVYGLISAYEVAGPKLAAWRLRRPGWAAGALLYAGGILLTTQVAGTATAFYTMFHFNRYASYGLLGNLLAVPLVGVWVMPAALLAFLLMPFGADRIGWHLMGLGIRTVSAIAHWVSALPGATLDLPAVPVSALLTFTLGGVWLCLWRRAWRLCGLVPMALAFLLYAVHRPPDLLIDAGGRLMAVREDDGTVRLSSSRAAKQVRAAWLRQAGQGDALRLWRNGGRLTCELTLCTDRANDRTVAILRTAEPFPPDQMSQVCQDHELVVAPLIAHAVCANGHPIIDGDALARSGTHAVWLGGEVRILSAAAWQGARPWRRSCNESNR